jgi:hypothetical protein
MDCFKNENIFHNEAFISFLKESDEKKFIKLVKVHINLILRIPNLKNHLRISKNFLPSKEE